MRAPDQALCAVVAIAAAALVGSAHATEIAPTPKMLADAKQMLKYEYPNDAGTHWEFHFRDLGGHILWCAYATGGNGGFCTRLPPGSVAGVDRAATEECKTADEGPLAHVTYGELGDLDYRCVRGHMSRLPADMALDREGYVRSQWKPLR
jgi:hypothetical protein